MAQLTKILESKKMADIKATSSLGITELEKTFEAYKSKLELAEQESSEIMGRALRKAESIIAEAREKTQSTAEEIKRKATEEADDIVLEAKNKAEQILREADDKSKKETKDKTKREVDKILADARQAADKQSAEIINSTRKEVEQIVNEIKEIAKVEAHKEASKIIAAAKEKAKKLDEDSIVRLTETNKFLAEVGPKTESILDQCKTQVQATLADLILAVGKAKDNLELRNVMNEIDEAGATKAPNKERENLLFKGQRELKIIPPYEDLQRRRFIEFLQQIPSIRLTGQAGTEDDTTIYINILEPLPLLTLLSEMSLVSSFDVRGDKIKLKLRSDRDGN